MLTKEQRREREQLAAAGQKRCTNNGGCNKVKSLNEFTANNRTWDKKSHLCKSCVSARSKKFYEKTADKIGKYQQRWRNKNPEYGRKYKAAKREHDPFLARLDDGMHRAKKAGNKWEHITSSQLLDYWQENNMDQTECVYCNGHIEDEDLNIDHATPIDRGGGHILSNLLPTHAVCNRQKSNMTAEEYREVLKRRHN